MAEQQQSNETNPQAAASKAIGSAMMGELSPFPGDDELPDHSEDIANIFGLDEEAGKKPNSSEGGSEGGASPSGASNAAERQEKQAQPATSPVGQPQPGQQGEPQAPAQQPQQTAPAAPAATPGDGQPQASTGDASIQALTAQVQALIAQNAQLQQALQQGAGQQAPQQGYGEQQPQQSGAQPPHPLMDYRLALPQDVVNAVFSDDPNVGAQGLTHIVNSIGRIVHERVIRHVDELMGQRLQDYGQQQQLTQQQENMRNEYFKDFPAHNNPGTRLIVAQEAQRMWTENPLLQWDDKARAALGTRVNTILGMTTPQQQGQQQQGQSQQLNGQANPAPRPAAQMGASNRPAANPQDNEADFMINVLTA